MRRYTRNRTGISPNRPEVFNTDQGSQFTSEAFLKVLTLAGVSISRDGQGRAFDNIMVERLWRTVKYEAVYLEGYETVPDARRGLVRYFDFYNHERRHSSLGKSAQGSFTGLKPALTRAGNRVK